MLMQTFNQLPVGGTVVGNEVIPMNQAGVTVQTTPSALNANIVYGQILIRPSVERQPYLPPATLNTGPGNLVRANSTSYNGGELVTNAAGTHQFVYFAPNGNSGTTASSEPALVTNPIVTTNPYNYGIIAVDSVRYPPHTTANPIAPIPTS
jgi:hypothetical protein